jgi:hypothetical protein
MLLTEKTSCVSASMLMVLRFNCNCKPLYRTRISRRIVLHHCPPPIEDQNPRRVVGLVIVKLLLEGYCSQARRYVQGDSSYEGNLAARHFKPLLKRAEFPVIRFHDLRHTFATLMLSSGEHPKIVQEILGHAQINLTLDTYSYMLPSMQGETVGKPGTLLS